MTDQNVTSGTAPALHVTYDPTTNRQTGECADANGNIGAATAPNCLSGYNYDAVNRIVAQTPVWGGAPSVAYAYNPSNKRVWKGTAYTYDSQTLKTYATVEEVTFWSISGQKLCTYNLTQYQPGGNNTQPGLVATQTATNYYFGGKLIKNTTGFVTPDRSGSIGKYFPYGQERPSATTDGKEKFATYFRDSETGLDYADQRYHQPGMGRFMTPDPSMVSNASMLPGNWNHYAYVAGDPVNKTDPRGLCSVEDDPPCYSTTGTDTVEGPDSCSEFAIMAPWAAVYLEGIGACGQPPMGPVYAPPPPPPPSCDDILTISITSFLQGNKSSLLSQDPNFISQVITEAKLVGVDPRLFIAETEESTVGNSSVAINQNNPFGLKHNEIRGGRTVSVNSSFGSVGDAVIAEGQTLNKYVNVYNDTVSQMYNGLGGITVPGRPWVWQRTPAYCQGSGCVGFGQAVSGALVSMGGDPDHLKYPGQLGSTKCK